jgi:acyl dehydratase
MSSPIESVTLPPITKEQLRAFAEASGDPNPIHLDESVAKQMGLPGIIAHGMLVSSFLSERALVIGEEHLHGVAFLKKFQIRFKAMTLLGDVLTLQAAAKAIESDPLALELSARNQRGEVVATASASLARA